MHTAPRRQRPQYGTEQLPRVVQGRRLGSQTDPVFDPGFPLTNRDRARYLRPLSLGYTICRPGTIVPTTGSGWENEGEVGEGTYSTSHSAWQKVSTQQMFAVSLFSRKALEGPATPFQMFQKGGSSGTGLSHQGFRGLT